MGKFFSLGSVKESKSFEGELETMIPRKSEQSWPRVGRALRDADRSGPGQSYKDKYVN